jgi:thioredoxin 2
MINDSMTAAAKAERVATVACQFCSTLNRVSLERVGQGPKCGSCGRPILLDRPLQVSDDTFQQVLNGTDIPVLVDFYADWCGPCRMMAPILDELAHDRLGEVLVLKLDTDRNPVTPSGFNIRGIPTMILFDHGRETARQTGAAPRASVDALLARAPSQ